MAILRFQDGRVSTTAYSSIDIKAIDDLEYDSSSTNVRADFGNSWGQVYSYLENFGRFALGVRSPSVGLATTLGGTGLST